LPRFWFPTFLLGQRSTEERGDGLANYCRDCGSGRLVVGCVVQKLLKSHFIQACDVSAYFLLQKYKPNAFIRRSGAQNYLDRLTPVLNKRASYSNGLGVVVL
jgi:hypothetical protein